MHVNHAGAADQHVRMSRTGRTHSSDGIHPQTARARAWSFAACGLRPSGKLTGARVVLLLAAVAVGLSMAPPVAPVRRACTARCVCAPAGGGCDLEARRGKLERVKGIEPSSAAWEAAALPLSYTRAHGDGQMCRGRILPPHPSVGQCESCSSTPVLVPPPWSHFAVSCEIDISQDGCNRGKGSFPRTEVRHLDPTVRIFRAAFTSRSCDSPQSAHFHCLTARCLGPLGPVSAPQLEHTRVVFL